MEIPSLLPFTSFGRVTSRAGRKTTPLLLLLAPLAAALLICSVFSEQAQAVPIRGGVSLAGACATDTQDLNTATRFTSFNNVTVQSSSGSFSVPVGTSVNMLTFRFNPFQATLPYLWSFHFANMDYSFELTALTFRDQPGNGTLTLRGTGNLTITGSNPTFDPTFGTWLFTATQGGSTFSFASSNAVVVNAAADAFNPNANGIIRVVVAQPDGKILIGGDFTTLAPNGSGTVTRNRIARLNHDGTLDTAFNPNANEVVYAIALQTDGKIVVGGNFTQIGGATRNHMARLDATTGSADSFNPNANDIVRAIVLQADGRILAGGDFLGIGGQPHNYIARLDPTTGLADSFDPNVSFGGIVRSIAVQADGKILAGGLFTNIGGQPRNRIARLVSATGAADSFNPNAAGQVICIAVQADGKILAGGDFAGIGGQPRNYIARLEATTGLADSFNPSADSAVYATAVQADGKILAGGVFSNIGGQPRNHIARLDATMGAADSLDPNANNDVNSIALQGDDILVGGSFTSIGGQGRSRIARLVPLRLATAVSRKTHGGAGAFDIPLPVTGEPAVECRSTGGNYTLVFTFNNNVFGGNANVTTGIGSVSGSPTFAGNTMTVNLAGVADMQKVTVTLSNVTDSFNQLLPNTAVSVNMLIGDTNGNKSVNATDVSQTKLQSGGATTATNFRSDVTVSGSINATDVSQVKLNSGHGVP